MNLVFIDNQRPVTDSLLIADEFGKEHRSVLRDIEVQLDKLNQAGMQEWGAHNFVHTQYQHPQNKQWYPKVNLTEDAFAIVAMSYVTPETMKMKVKFLEEFKRMREELSKPQHTLPQTMIEAVESYLIEMKKNAQLESDKQILTIENTEQKQKLKEQEAPVAIYNLAISANNTLSMAEVAKSFNTGRTRLYRILREEKLVMQNSTLPYQRFIDAGYFKVVERPRASGETIQNDPATRITAKGFDYIAKIMHRRNTNLSQAQ